MPSAEWSNDPGAFFCSGSVASSLAEGVQESHRLEPEAESMACAVMIIFLVFCFTDLLSISTYANFTIILSQFGFTM